jgi:hypothetical protein
VRMSSASSIPKARGGRLKFKDGDEAGKYGAVRLAL